MNLEKTYKLIGIAATLILLGMSAVLFSAVGWVVIAATLLCSTGALAIMFYALWLLKLSDKAMWSVVENLRQGKTDVSVPNGNKFTKSLCSALNNNLVKNNACLNDLKDQIGKLKIHIQLSQRQKRNTDAIIYSIRDAVIVIDKNDRLLMANEAAEKIFAFDFNECQSKPLKDVTAPDRKEFVELLRQSRQSKSRHKKQEIEFIVDNTARTYHCIVSCVYDEADAVCGVVGVLHDITREKEISQMKNDFVSYVSHELKTPLASITAYSELLIDGEASDEKTMKEFCTVIQTQAQRLNRLIDDILNTSRIESGLVKVDKKTLSLTMLIEEHYNMIRSFADEKKIKVTKPNPIVFDQVYADKDMISQVIINLLSNAVKYTEPGGKVTIKSSVDEFRQVARIDISDTGVGIPPDDIERVFDKFFRVEANKKIAKGTGLGLNLVKQIVENVHEGKVFVTSEVGKGSTFSFELPLAKSEVMSA